MTAAVKRNESNDKSTSGDDTDIIPSYDIEPMVEIQKQLKNSTHEHNAQELTEYKSILAETSRTLGESDSVRDSCLVALQNKQTEFERVFHNTNVSKPQLRSTQMKEKVVPNNSQVKDKKTEVEDHPRISRNIMINGVSYVEGLNNNLFSVGQFCDTDLEVAFWKSTCFVRDLQGNDLLTGNRGSDLYKISLQETTSSTPICLMAKALLTQAWLWHQRLSHLNFDYINLLSKKDVVIGLPKLKYVKD
ncbi:retrovirus-related pol polyprotein from transposon TNT 1-94 [Tanacetum coccineum]